MGYHLRYVLSKFFSAALKKVSAYSNELFFRRKRKIILKEINRKTLKKTEELIGQKHAKNKTLSI